MSMMKTCPICGSKALSSAKTCYECYYRFSDQSTRNVKLTDFSQASISGVEELSTSSFV